MSALAPKTIGIAAGETPGERWNHGLEITRILRDVLRIGRATPEKQVNEINHSSNFAP